MSSDQICFGKKKASGTCMQGATMLAVDEATDVEKDKFSGIIGLGPASDVKRIPAFLEQIDTLGGVGGKEEMKPIFSIFLSN